MSETRLSTLRMLANRFRRYGLSLTWFKAEAEAGRLPCLRVGRRMLFDADAIEAALIERAARGLDGLLLAAAATLGSNAVLPMALDACRAANRWARGQYKNEREIEQEVLCKTRAVLDAAGIREEWIAKGGDNGPDED